MADPNRWFDPGHVAGWDENPHRANPIRAEQLDIVADLALSAWQPETWILDLASGTGHLQELLFARHPDCRSLLLDYSPVVLARARARLDEHGTRAEFLQQDLTTLRVEDLTAYAISVAVCVQSFHHFPDPEKARQIAEVGRLLPAGALFLVQDRFAVAAAELYESYRALWFRQERNHDSEVMEEPLPGGEDNAASLPWFLERLNEAGFQAAPLHLHGTRAVIAARKHG